MIDGNGIVPSVPTAQLRIELYEGIRDGKLKHDQWAWFVTAEFGEPVSFNRQHCGTTACAAGWASLLAAPPDAIVYADSIELHGVREYVDDFAKKALGLGHQTAYWLFYNSNNDQALAQLKWLAEHPEANHLEVQLRPSCLARSGR